MSAELEGLRKLLAYRTDKYNKLEQHSIDRDVMLASIADMVLDENTGDRSDSAVLRAIRILINDHKRQMTEIAKLKGECYLLSKTIKYVD